MTYGTSHFVSKSAAVRYYRDYEDDPKTAVQHKLASGEIHIGKPKLAAGEKLSTGGKRYAITTAEGNPKKPAGLIPVPCDACKRAGFASTACIHCGGLGHTYKRKNPGKGAFKRCVAAVAGKGKAKSPAAVCADAGRKKYGAKKFAELAAAGRRLAQNPPGRWYPLTEAYDARDAKGLARELAKLERAKGGGQKYRTKGKMVEVFIPAKKNAGKSAVPARVLKGHTAIWGGKIPAGARAELERTYQRERAAKQVRRRSKRNPADAETKAAERYEFFHGKPPEDVTEFETIIHEPAVTSGIGKLVRLVVLAIDGINEVTLENFRGAILSQNIEGTQLYIDGGDQRVNLKDFGIDPGAARAQEVLGACREVWYDTTKLHLGDDGGDAIYHHKFGGRVNRSNPSRNAWGASSSRMPQIVYSVRNKLLMFAGGGYTLPKEGISG